MAKTRNQGMHPRHQLGITTGIAGSDASEAVVSQHLHQSSWQTSGGMDVSGWTESGGAYTAVA